MSNTRSVRLFSKLLTIIALTAMVFSTFVSGNIGSAQALGSETSISSQAADASSFYYYSEGKRIQLTPSLSWVAVKFASDDPGAQSAAVGNSSVLLGSIEQERKITPSSLSLLPLSAGVTEKTLRDGIHALRADAAFTLVNPVFQTSDAEMAISDEFVVTFPAGMGMDEINAVNASNGVEMVDAILGQENTFVLRVTGGADLLETANKYQESGIAIHSAPNFIRIVFKRPAEAKVQQDVVGPMTGTNDT